MSKKLKIAVLSPLVERVPPDGYGGTEKIVSLVTDELVKRGHSVTLYASGDSKTKAKLVRGSERALRHDKMVQSVQAYLTNMLATFFQKDAERFDIIWNNTDFNAFVFGPYVRTPIVTTLHGPMIGERIDLYRKYKKNNWLVSISNNQRKLAPDLNYIANIYHGIEISKIKPNFNPLSYLVWVGRISPLKGTEEAIDLAREFGRKLIMIGKVDKIDEDYFEENVKGYIDGVEVQYLGEVSEKEKFKILRKAYALLNPIRWQEPFGLVPIEAMASGTPVVATTRGSMPEVIDNNKSGILAKTHRDLLLALENVGKLDRKLVRKVGEERFNYKRMVDEYEEVFRKILKSKKG